VRDPGGGAAFGRQLPGGFRSVLRRRALSVCGARFLSPGHGLLVLIIAVPRPI